MGFTEVLTIVFVILKSTGHLNWSWWAVFSPELIGAGLYVVLLMLVAAGAFSVKKRIKNW